MRHIYMYENDKKIRNILPMRKTNSKKKVYYHTQGTFTFITHWFGRFTQM